MRNLGLHNLRDGGTVPGVQGDAQGDSPIFAPRKLGQSPPRKPRHSSAGVTLIELLVVISILMLLAAMAIPAVRPALEGRRIREAARAINIYLGVAQGEAMRTGRPCGVIFERVKGLPQCSMILQQAIVPPPYAGDTLDATARLQFDTNEWKAELTSFNPLLVSDGDLIQINYQGPWYTIKNIDGTELTIFTDLNGGGAVPWPDVNDPTTPDWSAALPYQILRRPIKSSAKPLKLPPRAVVDLTASGSDLQQLGWDGSWAEADPQYQAAQAPVMIMFSPNGSVERIIYMRYDPVDDLFEPQSVLVTRPIHLLIGKRERVTDQQMTASSTEEDWPNWADPTNLWVTINPQTGMVRTAENYYDGTVDNWNAPDWNNQSGVATAIRAARTFARRSKSMGGR